MRPHAATDRSLRRRARLLLRLGVVALLFAAGPLGLLGGGCTCSGPDAPVASGIEPPPVVAAPPPVDEARPVYPIDAGPPDPLATRFCEAVRALPERRRAECCASVRTGAAPVEECVRTLSYALAQRALTLDPARLDACEAAMKEATEGCDWVTPWATTIPLVCQEIFKGTIAEKAPCRSSLECAGALRCEGLSATNLGACGPPREARVQCGSGVDTLAASTRQDHLDREHPECAGHCVHRVCDDAIALGVACQSDSQCGKNHCVAGKCADAPLPALGAACVAGACAAGAGCVNGVCVAPKAEGAACGSSAECRGECMTEDGGAAGTCAKRCPPRAPPSRRLRVSPKLLQEKQ